MMYASDFRERARDALRGHWGAAVAVGLVASLLSGGVSVSNSGGAAEGYLGFASRELIATLSTVAVIGLLLAVVLGGAVSLGLCRFNINLVSRKEDARFNDLFSHFDRLWRGFVMDVTVSFFILLWCLLFVIPGTFLVFFIVEAAEELAMAIMMLVICFCVLLGIFAGYRYAMVPYLMAEFPELKTMDAIRESKRLMKGNKWRLFCLNMSFFGWALLCMFLTLGIGYLWLAPYMRAAEAAFYMYVTGRMGKEEPKQNPVEW